MSVWVEAGVALLLLASGVLALIGALGLLRLPTFFQRMHAPAVVGTLGVWCVALAAIAYFSLQAGQPALQAWLIVVLLAITAPVTTLLLARAALFRERAAAPEPVAPPAPRDAA